VENCGFGELQSPLPTPQGVWRRPFAARIRSAWDDGPSRRRSRDVVQVAKRRVAIVIAAENLSGLPLAAGVDPGELNGGLPAGGAHGDERPIRLRRVGPAACRGVQVSRNARRRLS
jgi:hypothetical protein